MGKKVNYSPMLKKRQQTIEKAELEVKPLPQPTPSISIKSRSRTPKKNSQSSASITYSTFMNKSRKKKVQIDQNVVGRLNKMLGYEASRTQIKLKQWIKANHVNKRHFSQILVPLRHQLPKNGTNELRYKYLTSLR